MNKTEKSFSMVLNRKNKPNVIVGGITIEII